MQLRGYQFFKVIYFIPNILPSVAVGFIWSRIFSPSMGILKPLMTAMGLGQYYVSPLAEPSLALAAIILAQVWNQVGVQIILFNSGFMGIPNEVIESASLDGAKGWKMIRYMVIPMSYETIKMVIILQLTGALRAFDLVYTMTNGGPNHATEVLPMHLFVEAFQNFNYGIGSVVAVVIFVPVSYTHLDVYKRQITTDEGRIIYCPGEMGFDSLYYNMEIFEANGWTPPETWSEFITLCDEMNAVGTVSYTHLDVYKRQA